MFDQDGHLSPGFQDKIPFQPRAGRSRSRVSSGALHAPLAVAYARSDGHKIRSESAGGGFPCES